MSSNGQELFGRAYNVTVAPKLGSGLVGPLPSPYALDVSALRCEFKAKKNLKPEPNTCEVKIHNLAESSRRVLEHDGALFLRLEAGYEKTGTSQLYFGEVRHGFTEWSGPTCITTVTTGDSEKEIAANRIHATVGRGVGADVVLASMCKALGVGTGNLGYALSLLKSKGVVSMYSRGTVISGNVARQLTDFCRSAGLEWSVQDGNVQILDVGKALSDLAVQLSSGTGLVGSPSISGKGLVKARSFIIPELAPGRKVMFQSKSVSGLYRIEEIEYSGDTMGNDWYADMACKKIT